MLIRLGEVRDRFEPIVAGVAVPEIGGAVRIGFNPLRSGDGLAALGAGIPMRQGAEIYSGHGESPVVSLIFEGLDRITVGSADVVRYL